MPKQPYVFSGSPKDFYFNIIHPLLLKHFLAVDKGVVKPVAVTGQADITVTLAPANNLKTKNPIYVDFNGEYYPKPEEVVLYETEKSADCLNNKVSPLCHLQLLIGNSYANMLLMEKEKELSNWSDDAATQNFIKEMLDKPNALTRLSMSKHGIDKIEIPMIIKYGDFLTATEYLYNKSGKVQDVSGGYVVKQGEDYKFTQRIALPTYDKFKNVIQWIRLFIYEKQNRGEKDFIFVN